MRPSRRSSRSSPAHRLARAFLLAVGMMLASTAARADLPIKWDCYLPGTPVDCVTLESSLLSKIPFVRSVSDRRQAEVVITLNSLPAENATRIAIDLVGKEVDGYATVVHTSDKIPLTADVTTMMVRIMTKLERGLDDFMDLKVAAEVKDGKLTLQLLDPVGLPYEGRPEQSSVKWFITPGVTTYFSDVEGVGVNASAGANLAYNYSETNWRLQQWAGIAYTQQSQPVPGTAETAKISYTNGSVNDVLSWAVSKSGNWNVGALFGAESTPQANYKMRSNASLGVELDLVPRQTVNQKNLGFHCAVGPEFQKYEAINTEGKQQQTVGRQFCDVYLSWHFQPIDVWAGLGETTLLQDFGYRNLSASFSATWRITDNLTFSPWINLQEIHDAVNQARTSNVAYSDPKQEIEASMRAAIEQGYTAPFGIQGGFAIKYILGNGSLSSEDQRWKSTSNLR